MNIPIRFVYADTSVWNVLYRQKVNPVALSTAMARTGAQLVLGFNVVYEFAKLFCSGNSEKEKLGMDLFDYLRRYLERKIPLIKENRILLKEEALDATGQFPFNSSFSDSSDYGELVKEVDRMCGSSFSETRDRFIRARKALVENSRSSAREHFKSRPAFKQRLAALDESGLAEFTTSDTAARQGELIIFGHLSKIFVSSEIDDLSHASRELVASPRYRITRAMVRGSLYLNWRCARFGSIRDDMYDNMFHVVNSAYCNAFLTTERDQTKLAGHVVEGVQAILVDQRLDVLNQLVSALGADSVPEHLAERAKGVAGSPT